MRLARETSRGRVIQGADAQNSAPLPDYKILKALSRPFDTSPPVEADTESLGRTSPKNKP
jgi:hypothetical protein